MQTTAFFVAQNDSAQGEKGSRPERWGLVSGGRGWAGRPYPRRMVVGL